jgi:hypothetical protein
LSKGACDAAFPGHMARLSKQFVIFFGRNDRVELYMHVQVSKLNGNNTYELCENSYDPAISVETDEEYL